MNLLITFLLFLVIGLWLIRPLVSRLFKIRNGKYTSTGKVVLVLLALLGFICSIFSGGIFLVVGSVIAFFFFILFSDF